MNGSSVHKLRASAEQCRRLAESAADPDVARVLSEMAGDIDTAIPILEEHMDRAVAAQSAAN
jgi:hypothetical protein